VGAAPPRPTRFRLKRSLELFPASDGALYLMRSGSQADFVLPDASEEDRHLLDELRGGFRSIGDLEASIADNGNIARDLLPEIAHLEGLGLLDREPSIPLGDYEAERYHRQLIYFADFAPPGVSADELQQRLTASRVVVLGTGGLGCWAAAALACAGIGSLRLVDDDRVELSNLNRQLLFGESDIGELKIDAAARALAAHDSRLEIETVDQRVRGMADVAGLIGDADLLLATADWPPYELPRWINEACLLAGVPYLTAGQFPPLIRVGPMVIPGATACLECQESKIRREFPLYDELAAFQRDRPTSASTFAAASGLVGTILANESIHHLTGVCQPATVDRALIIDLRTLSVAAETIEREPLCSACSR
jgi:bacteriocin biosynthesis cyclodehydratase domain-containing protein